MNEYDISEVGIKKVYDEPYLNVLPKVSPVTIYQLCQLIHSGVYIWIKPSSHKCYWDGEAKYIPPSMYEWKVIDIALIRPFMSGTHTHGSLAFYVETSDKWEEIAGKKELEEINNYYHQCSELD